MKEGVDDLFLLREGLLKPSVSWGVVALCEEVQVVMCLLLLIMVSVGLCPFFPQVLRPCPGPPLPRVSPFHRLLSIHGPH